MSDTPVEAIAEVLKLTRDALDDVQKKIQSQSVIVSKLTSELTILKIVTDKLENKIFSGDGSHSITTQVALLHTDLTALKDALREHIAATNSKTENIKKEIRQIISENNIRNTKIIVSLIALIGGIATAIIKYYVV